ncbi:MAG: proton-conducting transporter membrane subunit [Verrucomicrobiae bacterium]|nr:proton-conducting transporter membrane subunit [Verrucomicrobiae bacterium]
MKEAMNLPNQLILLPLLAVVVVNLPLGLRWAAMLGGVFFSIYQMWTMVFLPPLETGFFDLQIDGLSRVLLLSIGLVAFVSILAARGTIRDKRERFYFYNLVLLAMVGMNGLVMVRDLFSLYVFIEITSVASFILIALRRELDGLEGAFKYLIMSAVATAMMLSAVALLLLATGETSFAKVAEQMRLGGSGLPVLAAGLFVAGLLIKAGSVPFHGWLPDAYMAAPNAASILLGGIVTKTTGVYALIRLMQDGMFGTGMSPVLLLAGAVSIVAGALAALGQRDFKRMLAYSSISQVGYIVLSLGTGTALGVVGAVFHLFNHAVFKSLLFVNATAVEDRAGTRDMNQLGGLAARMPVTGFASVVALLSTAGVPPLAGFWSKLVIIVALYKSGHPVYAAVAVLASLLTLAYFLSMQRRVFFGKLREGLEGVKEAGWYVLVPTLALTLITMGVGVLIPWMFGSFVLPMEKF